MSHTVPGSGDDLDAMAVWCDRCGTALRDAVHGGCAAARPLEPPRFCPHCRRRMTVQVLPAGWSATCVQHGTTTAGGPASTGGTAGASGTASTGGTAGAAPGEPSG